MQQFHKKALTRLAVFCLGTSALTLTPSAVAQVIDYPNGTNNASPIVLTGNSTQLQVLTGTATQSGVISQSGGSFGLEKIGVGMLTFTGANTYTGVTTISAGTLQIGDGTIGHDGNLLGPVVANGALIFNYSNAFFHQYNDSISGTGSLTQSGFTVILTGTNTYTGGTTIASGSTLQIGSGGSSGSIVGDVVNNGALALSRSDSIVFGGNISGSGKVTVPFQGTVTLTGNNSYTGGTVLTQQAVLRIGNGGVAGSLVGNIDTGGLNARVAFNRSDTTTFGGIISGAGQVAIWSGTVNLTGANTHTGGTFLTGGTLSVTSDANLGATSGPLQLSGCCNAIEAGTLRFGAAFNMAASRAITLGQALATIDTNGFSTTIAQGIQNGTGGLVKAGLGVLTLGGQSTYAGGTTVNAGTLRLGTGARLLSINSLTINGGAFDLNGNAQTVAALSGTGGAILLGSGSLTTNSSANTILFSQISGSGSLTKLGAGGLTLSGVNTYSGTTTVTAGALKVTGSIANSSVNLANGAMLTGAGTVGSATITSGGTLAPGNSIGTFTVNGNLTLAAGSVYNVEVSPTAADRTVASGSAGLNGTVAASVDSGTYTFGQRFAIVTATGGVSGTFTSLTGIPTTLRGQLSYDANNAYLTLSPNALAPLLSNATGNQSKVAAAIDASVAAGGVPGGGFVALYGLSGPALNSALDQISGQVGPNTINAVGQNSLSFLTMTAQGGSGGGNFAPGSAFGGADAPHRAQLGAGETRIWAAAYGGHVGLSADAASGAASLSSNNVGLIGGIDMAWDSGFLAGVTVGLGQQHFSSGNGTGSSDDIMIGVYARKDMGPLYVTAAFSYGTHHIETLRVITVSGTDVLQGKQNADDYGGRLEAGWRMALDDQYRLAPYFAVAAASFDAPAYAETAISGASTFALSFAPHSSTLGRTELGGTLSRDYEIENGLLTADLRAAWAHQLDDLPFTQAGFQSLPGASFLVTGVRPAGDTALLGASVQVQNRSGLFFGFKGETQLGAGTTILTGMGNLGWRW